MDRGRAVVGAVRLIDACDTPRCHQPAREAGSAATAATGAHVRKGFASGVCVPRGVACLPLAAGGCHVPGRVLHFESIPRLHQLMLTVTATHLRVQARETGICPVREELYAQCFDELIREVTINCAERGLLLLRVRDETRMTIAAYQTLYESAVAFGMRKALQTEQGKNEMEARIQTLEGDVKDLERQVQEWKLKCEAIEKRQQNSFNKEQHVGLWVISLSYYKQVVASSVAPLMNTNPKSMARSGGKPPDHWAHHQN
ncbi:uncharacterized protein HaLaN_19133, partial [Haematococcus lacustris]